MLCSAAVFTFSFLNSLHGCIINYAYQNTEGLNFADQLLPLLEWDSYPLDHRSHFAFWAAPCPYPIAPQLLQVIWVHSTGNKYEVLNTRYAHFSACKTFTTLWPTILQKLLNNCRGHGADQQWIQTRRSAGDSYRYKCRWKDSWQAKGKSMSGLWAVGLAERIWAELKRA